MQFSAIFRDFLKCFWAIFNKFSLTFSYCFLYVLGIFLNHIFGDFFNKLQRNLNFFTIFNAL